MFIKEKFMKISNGVEIGGLQKLTLIDYPGRIACTVFLIGCSFRCPWCYSSELVLPEKIKLQPRVSEKDFFKFLKERKGLLEGVCITGGEPTINKDLPGFIKKIKKLGYEVKLDTNGINPSMLKDLIDKKLIDYVAMDIKAPKEKYRRTVGLLEYWNEGMLKNIEKSILILKDGKVDCEFRSTIVPSLHKKEDVIKMAKWVKGAKKYYLQNFRPEKTVGPKFEKIKPYSWQYLIEIQKAIAPFFEICETRG